MTLLNKVFRILTLLNKVFLSFYFNLKMPFLNENYYHPKKHERLILFYLILRYFTLKTRTFLFIEKLKKIKNKKIENKNKKNMLI